MNSRGRFTLGLGTQVKPHNERRFSVPWISPAPRMAEYVQALRAIWRCWENGEKLDFKGKFFTFTLMTPEFSPKPSGLPMVPVMIAASAYGLIAYLVGNFIFANYLQLHFVPGVGEIAIYCAAMIGAGLGFLWYNAPPAKIFMGDTGALALGGGIGAAAVATRQEIILAIIGGLFVAETLSVVIQVAWFKRTGKRIFLMAPIHHHFEKLGWSESTVVIRFWIVSIMLALLGLATLKLR